MTPLWCRFCDPAGFEACPCTALEPERLRFGAGSAVMAMPHAESGSRFCAGSARGCTDKPPDCDP